MKLTVKNIAGIGSATLDFNGITVIAGENNTGKSTIGKSIYSIISGLSTPVSVFYGKVLFSLCSILRRYMNYYSGSDFTFGQHNISEFARNKILKKYSDENLSDITTARSFYSKSSEEIASDYLNYLLSIVSVDKKNEKDLHENFPFYDLVKDIDRLGEVTFASFISQIVIGSLNSEFKSQVVNFSCKDSSFIRLLFDNGNEALFQSNESADSQKFSFSGSNLNFSDIYSYPVYIDSPFVLDDLNRLDNSLDDFIEYSKTNSLHAQQLTYLLKKTSHSVNIVDKMINETVLNEVLEKLSSIYKGEIVKDRDGFFVKSDKYGEKQLNISNLSSGLKIFAILKQLIINGVFKNNCFLIFDEPEIHVHPKLQIILAEIIVLLRKILKIQVIITSHSPYFIEAIDVFSRKHNISEAIKFYLSGVDSNGNFTFVDKTQEQDAIYKLLAAPFQVLEDENAWLNDNNV